MQAPGQGGWTSRLTLQPSTEMIGYGLQHNVKLLEHCSVLEANHPNSLLLKKGCTLGIIVAPAWIIMRVSVEFDSEFFCRAIKVEDIRADAMLATEFASA